MTAIANIALILVSVRVLSAGPIVFSNLDATDPRFQTGSGSFFGPLVGDLSIANGFVPNGSYLLGSIEVAISRLTDDNVLFVSLMADDGFRPGAVLETFDLSGSMALFGEATSPVVALSVLHPQMEEGVLYWVVAQVGSSTFGVWHQTNGIDIGPRAVESSPGSWTAAVDARDAFQVNGADVPEPSTFASVVAALAVFACSAIRRTTVASKRRARAPR